MRKSDIEFKPLALRLFLQAFGWATLAFALLLHGGFYFNAMLQNQKDRAAMDGAVRYAAELVGETLAAYAADLRMMARMPAVRRLAAGDETALETVQSYFRIFADEKPVTAQLRVIGVSGRELVRVDRIDGKVVTITGDDLQDKSNRYYFTDSVGLPDGVIYISPLDLNVEHEAIEVPWNPMLRLAMPLWEGGKSRGIIIVNIKAGHLLRRIEHVRDTGLAPLQFLNAEGFWLAGAPPDRLWGFMFGRRTTMADLSPGVWARIRDRREGSFDLGGEGYAFYTVFPHMVLEAAGGRASLHEGKETWTILGTVPATGLADLWTPGHLGFGAGGLLLLAAVCLGWARVSAARHLAEEREQAAARELIRMERLASLGSLVAGVAHELNTPIGNARTVASTMAEKTAAFSAELAGGGVRRSGLERFLADMAEGTQIMGDGLERAARLIHQFKQVAVDQTSEQRRRFLLTDLVRDVIGTMRPQFRHSAVRVEADLAATREIDGYPGPLGQVLINLIGNALVHAFDPGAAGTITVRTRDLPDDRVEIAVRDDGRGIPADLREKIFEPFFTTRLGQGGSGLGLSIVHNIVTGTLGGSLRVESRFGEGTAMIVQIPASAPADAGQANGRIYDVGE